MDNVIGDRNFYRTVFGIVVPVIIQNLITSFVSLLDNIMVGQIGTAQMSGVAIANQLIFIFNICIFGGISGASIYGAQFYGAKDYEGMRACMRVGRSSASTLQKTSCANWTSAMREAGGRDSPVSVDR